MSDDPITDDPWTNASEHWKSVSEALRDRYSQVVGEDGPGEDDVRMAFVTIGGAARAVAASIEGALRDPATRDQLKQMSSSIASAVGATLTGLADELRSHSRDEEE